MSESFRRPTVIISSASLSILTFSFSACVSRLRRRSWCPFTYSGLTPVANASLTSIIRDIMSKQECRLENEVLGVSNDRYSALLPSQATWTTLPWGANPDISNALSARSWPYRPPSSALYDELAPSGPGTIPPPTASCPNPKSMIHAHEQQSCWDLYDPSLTPNVLFVIVHL